MGRRANSFSSRDVHVRRLWLVLGAVIYGGWWALAEVLLPGSYNPLWGRIAVGAVFLAVAGASYVSDWVARRLPQAIVACASLLTLHYFYLLVRNNGSGDWVVGAYVTVLAASMVFESTTALLAYSIYVLALAVAAYAFGGQQQSVMLVPGLATVLLLGNLLLRSRAALEHERDERVRLEAEHEAAKAAVTLREEFIAVAAHELRTPLGGLRMSTHLAAEELLASRSGQASDKLGYLLEGVERQVARLSKSVDMLLDTSKLREGGVQLELAAVDCASVVGDCLDLHRDEVASSGCSVDVSVTGDVTGTWDRRRLEQIVSNLIRNALAYGKGKPIRLQVVGSESHVRIVVADQGIGISNEDQERIFDRFERAVRTHDFTGMGLGLYIVRMLVEAHRGTVRVESEVGKGARFIVELPRDSRAYSVGPRA